MAFYEGEGMITALLITSIISTALALRFYWSTWWHRDVATRILRERIAQLEKENTALKVMHRAAIRQLNARDELDVLDAAEIG